MATVSIVIRALNEAAHLPALFEGIAAQTRQPEQVVLVDSGSTDESVAISQAAGADIVHIAPEDFSFGRALNVGCEAASGDVLVFVSAHVYPVDELWLERMIAPFETHDDVSLVYGRQTGDEDLTAFSEMEIMRRWFPDKSDPDQDHPFCNNANCAVRASVWRDLPYDELLTGLEDMAWAKRAQELGHRLWYEAGASIVHLHDEPFSKTVNRYRREAIAHKRIFGHQKMSAFEALGLFLANTGRDYLASVPRRKFFRNVVAIPQFRAAQFWGSWKGFRQDGDPTGTLKRHFYYPKGFTPRADRLPR
jgi:glycosyltransferase involved in cell wall biosynthesis